MKKENKMPKKWLHMGAKELHKGLFQKAENRLAMNKAKGGVWASPFEERDGFLSHWHEMAWKMELGEKKHGVLFEIKEDAKITVIDSRLHLMELTRKYQRQDEREISILGERLLDFEKIAKDYDVLFLTEDGEQDTRMGFRFDEPNLSGWDCASCIIFNFDVIINQKPIEIEAKEIVE